MTDEFYASLRSIAQRDNQPGDKFRCAYTYIGTAAGTFGPLKLAESQGALTANADGSKTQEFHFVFVGYAPDGSLKFVADRNLQSTTWEILSAAGYCASYGINGAKDAHSPRARFRLLHSALAAGEEGEWDALLVNNPIASDWNTSAPSWTLNVALDQAANRVVRGGEAADTLASLASTGTSGFRPVLLIDPDPQVPHRADEDTECPLVLVDNVKRIEPGQAISCEYTAASGALGTFANLGRAEKAHISDLAPAAPDGTFYFICVGYAPNGDLKLVADRNIQGNISWETLNAAGYCAHPGASVQIDGIDGLSIRLPGTIADKDVEKGIHGEWDAIISFHDLDGKITPSDNAVWNCLATRSWTLGIPSNYDAAYRITRGGQDKNSALRQAIALSTDTSGFRPVLLVHRESRFLYLDANGKCYTAVNKALVQLSDDWASLSDAEQIALFKSKGNETIAAASVLEPLEKLRLLGYTGSEEAAMTVKLHALPPEQTLLPTELLPIQNFEGINQARLQGEFSGGGSCFMAVTTDLSRYKVYRDGAWTQINAQNAETMKESGMDASALAAVPRAAWDELTLQEEGIAFAFLIVKDACADAAALDKLTLTADLRGQWEMALPGADYSYAYPCSDLLRVILKTDGDYKINYESAATGEIKLTQGEKPASETGMAAVVVSAEEPNTGKIREGDLWLKPIN